MKLLIWVSVLLSVFLILSARYPNLLSMPETIGPDFSVDQQQSVGSGLKQIDLLTVIGAIIVFIYYWTKFGQWHGEEGAPPGFKPQPARHFTTWLRYSSWACFYAAVMVACYLLIVLFPTIFLMILGLLEKMNVHEQLSMSPDLFRSLQNAILLNNRALNSGMLAPYAVIIVILVWAGAFRKQESKARRKLQESALIPNEAQGLIFRLRQIETISDGDNIQPDQKHFEKALFLPESETLKKIFRKMPTLISEEEFLRIDEDYLIKFCRCRYFEEKLKAIRAESGSADIWQIYETELSDVEKRLSMLQDDMERYREELVQALEYAKKIEKYENEHAALKIGVSRLEETMSIRDLVNLPTIPEDELRRRCQEERIQILEEVSALQNKLDDQSNLSAMLRSSEDDRIAYDSLTLPQIKEMREKTAVKRLPFERRYFKNAEKRLENRIDQCFRILQQIIACGVLAVGKSYHRRLRLFEELSLKMPGLTGIPLNRNFVFKAALFLGFWVGVSTLVYWNFVDTIPVKEGCEQFKVPAPSGFTGAIMWTLSAVMMHTLGIIAAYLVENALLTDRNRSDNGTPASLINTDFALSFFFGAAMNIFFLSIMMAAANNFKQLAGLWYWALVPGLTAYFTAYYISQSKKIVDPSNYLVALQGALTALMTLIVILLIWNVSPADVAMLYGCQQAWIFCLYSLVSTFIVGTILSYLTQKVAVRRLHLPPAPDATRRKK